MNTIFLTSAGLYNKKIEKSFLDSFSKSPKQISVAFVTAAATTEEEIFYCNQSKQKLLELGFSKKNILEFDLKTSSNKNFSQNFDLIFVCGGNTYVLLNQLRKSGFDTIIINHIKGNKVYFGISAGSIVLGPNISPATPNERNKIDLSDTRGLNIVNFSVFPHFKKEKDKKFLRNIQKEADFEIKPLTNNQAILIKDHIENFISID